MKSKGAKDRKRFDKYSSFSTFPKQKFDLLCYNTFAHYDFLQSGYSNRIDMS